MNFQKLVQGVLSMIDNLPTRQESVDPSPDGCQLCEPKMVPTMIFNHYFLSSLGFQFNHAIEKHKKSEVWCGIMF